MTSQSTPDPNRLNQHDFTATYKRYRAKVNSFLAYRGLDKDMAADLTQDVFMKVYHNLHRHDPTKGALISWICQIARNTAITHLQRVQARKTTPFSQQWEGDEAVEHQTSARAFCFQPEPTEEVNELRLAIERLSPKLRQVIELAYFGGLTYEDIGEELSIPMGTVKNRIHIAKQELRKRLTAQPQPVAPVNKPALAPMPPAACRPKPQVTTQPGKPVRFVSSLDRDYPVYFVSSVEGRSYVV